MPEVPKYIQYYYKEDTNQILVSGSATASDPLTVSKMNTLLNASKSPTTTFDSEFTSKISSLGTNVSYVVQNGLGVADVVIPIASDQELWVYRGYNIEGGDGLTYRYNPYIHRPYKAYILTETGSGVPNSPWLNLGTLYYGSYTTGLPGRNIVPVRGGDDVFDPFDSLLFDSQIGSVAYELGINGNYINSENTSSTYPAPNGLIYTASISGSFTVYGESRQIHPWIYTRYTNSGNISTLNGSSVFIYKENIVSETYSQSFNTNTSPTTPPATGKMKFNSTTAAGITKITLSQVEDGVSNNILSLDSKMTNLEGITTDKDLGKIHISSSATNFLSLNITDAVSIGDGNLIANGTRLQEPVSPYIVNQQQTALFFDDTKYTTDGSGTGVIFGVSARYDFPAVAYIIDNIKVNNSTGGSGWQTGEKITITAATLNANGFVGATGNLVFTVTNANMDQLETSNFYEIVGTLDSTSTPFTMFTNDEDLNFSFDGPFQQGTLLQQQLYSPNNSPTTYPNNTLTNGYYTYTSSIFESTPGAGTGPTGSTQFGLYADLGEYVLYRTQLELFAANSVRINFTADSGLPEFIDLDPGKKVTYTAIPGSVTFTGTYNSALLSTEILADSANGETIPDIFSTRWSDVYVSFSASNSSSIDGLYIFNQIPSNDVEITASMFLRSWTGSDAGPKYGAADYALSPDAPLYGAGETGEGKTWPTASMKIYTGSYPDNVPVIGPDNIAYEVEFKNADIDVNGIAITMSFSIPADNISLRDCLSLSLAVDSAEPLSEIENSLVVTEYNLEFNTIPLASSGDGRVPTFIENAFEGTNGFSNTPDCQPLLNNAFTYRRNDQIQEVDYSTDIYTPINFQQILNGTAQKSSVPASNYTSRTWTLARYNGSRSTAERLNEAPTLQLERFYTYGNIPVIDYQRAFFAYCEQVTDPYPVLNNKTQFNIKYLINGAGDANNPNLSPYTAFDIQGTWSPTTNPSSSEVGRVGMNQISGSTSYNLLNGFQPIDRVTQQAVPILYSQTSSVGYSNFIPIRSKGISSYTPPFTQYGMTYQGTVVDGSNAASKVITIPNILSQIINNPNGITKPDRYSSLVVDSIVSTAVAYANEGEVYFSPDPDVTAIQPQLSANYTLDFRGSFPSTVPQTYRTDAGGFWDKSDFNSGVVGTFTLEMEFSDSTNLGVGTTFTRMSIQQTANVTLTCYFGGTQSLVIDLFNAYGSSHVGFINNGKTLRVNLLGDATKNAITQAGLSIDNVKYTTLDVAIKNAPNEQLISDRRYRISITQDYLSESVDAAKNFWNPITTDPIILGPFVNMVVNPNQQDPDSTLVDNALNAPYWEFPATTEVGTTLTPETQIESANANPVTISLSSLSKNADNLLAQANASSFNILGATNFGEQAGKSLAGGSGDGNAVATITLTDATVMGNIQITNGGTGYEVGDTLTIPSASLGAEDPGGVDVSITLDATNFTPTISATINSDEYSVTPGNAAGSTFTIGAVVGSTDITLLSPSTPGSGWAAGQVITIPYSLLIQKGFIITSLSTVNATFTVAADNLNTIPLRSQIELQSSNGNTTYNDGFIMGTLTYAPSTNVRFPGGLEPDDTTFPDFNIPWNLEIGDEIRFVNDEAESYTIKAITPPDQNSNSTTPKLLLVLDREVPASVDKDFFLLRRFVYEPSAILIDAEFPYGELSSTTEFIPTIDSKTTYLSIQGVATSASNAGEANESTNTSSTTGSFVTTVDRLLKKNNTPSGFLFPEFPAPSIELEPDVIMRELRDNKLIT
jgi:hypothetical protein